MVKRRILVVDDSPAMRETLCVLLGADYEIRAISAGQLAGTDLPPFDLTIAPADLAGSALLPAAARLWLGGEFLSRRFRPTALRRQVAAALPDAAVVVAAEFPGDWRLRAPFLDESSQATVDSARASGLALHIAGEPGSGKHAVARAIHHGSGGAFHVCDGDNPTPAAAGIGSGPATLLAIGIERWPAQSQRALSATLTTRDARHLRVISTATEDLAELVDRDRFLPDLYYQLTLLAIRLRPLRDRPDDIPAIAAALARETAERLGRPLPSLTPAALQRLSRYLWFGNVAELESVLTRTLALTQSSTIDAADIRFTGSAAATPADATVSPPTPDVEARSTTPGNLNLLIHELAHEFKNPLVTIKTFTQYCQNSLRSDAADELEFAQLTDRAVNQMDEVLENLLAFTRLARPEPCDVSLENLLRPLVANGSDLRIDYVTGPPVTVHVDPMQTTYALDNLLHTLSRGVPPEQSIVVRVAAPDMLLCEAPPGYASANDKLTEIVGDDAGAAASEVPLGIAIASAVLERNGARLQWTRDGDTRTAMIRFPVVENAEGVEEKRNGTSQSLDR